MPTSRVSTQSTEASRRLESKATLLPHSSSSQGEATTAALQRRWQREEWLGGVETTRCDWGGCASSCMRARCRSMAKAVARLHQRLQAVAARRTWEARRAFGTTRHDQVSIGPCLGLFGTAALFGTARLARRPDKARHDRAGPNSVWARLGPCRPFGNLYPARAHLPICVQHKCAVQCVCPPVLRLEIRPC